MLTEKTEQIENELLSTQKKHAELLLRMTELSQKVREAEENLKLLEAQIIEDAFASRDIGGKNAEERGRAIKIYLASQAEYQKAQKQLARIETEYEMTKCEAEAAARLLGTWHSIAQMHSAQLNYMSVNGRR